MRSRRCEQPLDCWDLAKNGCAPKPQDFVPTKIIPHESYNAPNPFQHDIALLKLDRPVVRNGTSVSQDFQCRVTHTAPEADVGLI